VVERLEKAGAAASLLVEARSRLEQYKSGVKVRAPWH
jgi:hypothetical protein